MYDAGRHLGGAAGWAEWGVAREEEAAAEAATGPGSAEAGTHLLPGLISHSPSHRIIFHTIYPYRLERTLYSALSMRRSVLRLLLHTAGGSNGIQRLYGVLVGFAQDRWSP